MTWQRFVDPAELMHARVAVLDGQLIGLTHRLFHRSTTRVEGTCYLQDLFTVTEQRGRGVARALIESVYALARDEGVTRVYWQTHESNAAGRLLYDKVARHIAAPAVDAGVAVWQTQVAQHGQALCGEGFVEFDDVHLRQAQAREFQHLARGRCRAEAHDARRQAGCGHAHHADAWSIVQNNSTIGYPVGTKDVHHETEMVVAIGKGGKNISVEQALDHVWCYGVGLDMTRRDIQGEAKKQGRSWEMGKSFDESEPVTALRPVSEIGHPAKGRITLKVNGHVKQTGDLAMQIWSVPEQISYLSHLITLQAGDLIFSGTPAGGPVKAGDKLEGHVDGVGELVISYKA